VEWKRRIPKHVKMDLEEPPKLHARQNRWDLVRRGKHTWHTGNKACLTRVSTGSEPTRRALVALSGSRTEDPKKQGETGQAGNCDCQVKGRHSADYR
jgi:hypothetical protein